MSDGTWAVHASLDVSYRVAETEDVLSPENDALARAARTAPGDRRLIVVDETVLADRSGEITGYFRARGVTPTVLALPGGEQTKVLASVERIAEAADSAALSRRDPIVAIGGGVLTDMVGLAAGLYRRGTPYVRIPTTLIGLVDAAVGVKTAVNFHGHKNRLGFFHAASDTLLDRRFLRTLSTRHITNGLAEIVKMGVIADVELFDLLDTHAERLVDGRLDGPEGRRVIRLAVGSMLAELQPNLWEHDLRRAVDFGHTFSPALEMAAQPGMLHGEAVSVDMALSCALAVGQGLQTADEALRVLALLRRVGLPVRHEHCTVPFLLAALQEATRHRGGEQNLPLPIGIGKCFFAAGVTEAELRRASALLHRLLDGTGAVA